MDNVMFIGNGLNRCNNLLSWRQLLDSLLLKYNLSNDASYQQDVFTLEFERIINVLLKAKIYSDDRVYYSVKKLISSEMLSDDLKPSRLHKTAMQLPVNTIITTNYDYLLEKAIIPEFSSRKAKAGSRQRRYSLDRKQIINGKTIYHIHGEAIAPSSICLGFEHYVGLLTQLKNCLISHNAGHPDVVLLNVIADGKSSGCFADLFFTHNIYFIGYGLDISEIDVWWLLTYRAYLMNSNYRNMSLKINNKITYYYVSTLSSRNYKLEALLQSYNIEVIWLELKKNYEDCYSYILENINRQIN